MRHPDVQRAAATLRWTGSWNTVFLTVDRLGGRPLDRRGRAGARPPRRPLPDGRATTSSSTTRGSSRSSSSSSSASTRGTSAATSSRRLLDVLSSRDLPDGTRGLFHPDRFSFGQTIYLSPILAAARDVPGVASADVVAFQRQGTPDRRYLADGRLTLGRLEIARLDNDPNFPEHGVLRLDLRGGK